MASWFAALRGQPSGAPRRALGPPFAAEEDPWGASEVRLLRRPVTWDVADGARGAGAGGAGEAFLSLSRLRLAGPGGGASIPFHAIGDERYEQPIFGCNRLVGTAAVGGRCVEWSLRFESGGSTAFITVFFRALSLARSGTELDAFSPAVAAAHARAAAAAVAADAGDPSCVWAEATPVDESAPPPAGPVPTATAVRVGLFPVNGGAGVQ